MLSIEEIKLLIEKLEKVKSADLQKLIDSNLKILKDLEQKVKFPIVDPLLFNAIKTKINQFAKTNMYNSLEIGPGTGMFSKEFRAWRLNYFLDVLPELEQKLRRRFNPGHQHHLKFYFVDSSNYMATAEAIRKIDVKTGLKVKDFELAPQSQYKMPEGSCNFVFSWDTFVFFTRIHIKRYLENLHNVLIPGGYCFIHYADCHFDYDLREAQRGYWNYNTKTIMEKIIKDAGYEVIQMDQFRPGANFAIFKKPGNQNPVVYEIDRITID